MKNTKQKIAIASVTVLLIFSVISGLVVPYLQNFGTETVDKNAVQNEEKIAIPDFEFKNLEGETVNLSDFAGKPIVMNFWGTWCPFCTLELPEFDKAAAEYGDKVNFILLDVEEDSNMTRQAVADYLAEKGIENLTTYYDDPGYGIYIFGVNSFPLTVYIDSEGYFFNAKSGMTSYDEIVENINAML